MIIGVKIVKDNVPRPEKEAPARVLSFDKSSMDNLTVSDLKTMKDEKERIIFSDEIELEESEEEIIEIENKDDDELSDEEIDRIIFKS